MLLAAGSKIGPYEVVSLLGSGGMGEVYRARDPRLGRYVAIKVLRAEGAADPDHVKRFEREARAVGAFDHPNILAVHDFGNSDGLYFLVTELLDGQTLRHLLDSGRLPLSKAIALGAQIARGLAAAHDAGVVHRDLKPENLFITRGDRIKILDFGLAQVKPSVSTQLSTATLPLTRSGVMMGTVGYMAPEQIRGENVDARADVFALGCVLYEMLGGKPPFAAPTAVETMNAILNLTQESLSGVGGDIPSYVDRVLQHCLEKHASDRYEAAKDLAFDLEALAPVSDAASARMRTPVASRQVRLMATAAILLAVLSLTAVLALRRPPAPAQRFQRLTFRRGVLSAARFASDARTIVYSAAWDGGPLTVYTTRTESPESTLLPLPSAALFALSPAGEMALALRPSIRPPLIVYEGTLARAALGGGGPRELATEVSYADWSLDGSQLAIVTKPDNITGQARELQFPIGRARYTSQGWISHPRIAPNGHDIAFVDHTGQTNEDRGSIVVLDSSNAVRRLSEDWTSIAGLAWAPAGDELWFSGSRKGDARDLWAINAKGRLRLLMSVPGGLTLHDLDSNSRALISLDRHRDGILGRPSGASEERDLSWLDWSNSGDLSQDGKLLLFTELSEGAGSNYRACLRGMDGTPVVVLGDGFATALSFDTKWAIAIVPQPKTHLVMYPTGAGVQRSLDPGTVTSFAWASWFPDGRRIVFAGAEPGSQPRTWIQDVGGGPPRPITEPGTVGYGVTPDGRFVVAEGSLLPIDGGPARRLSGWVPGDIPAEGSLKSDDVYLWHHELPSPVYHLDLKSGRRTLWKTLMPADSAGLASLGPVTVSADGSAYVYTYTRFLSDLYLVDGLK